MKLVISLSVTKSNTLKNNLYATYCDEQNKSRAKNAFADMKLVDLRIDLLVSKKLSASNLRRITCEN